MGKMSNCSLIAIVFVTLVSWSCASYVCLPKSCNGKKQTLCAFPSGNPNGRCATVKSASLTNAEINEIVNRHNQLRDFVASGQEARGAPGRQPAGIIPHLQWDSELAAVAQRWANQCQFGHDECRDTNSYSVGQNVGIIGRSNTWGGSVSDIINSWYNEVKDFNKNHVKKFVWQEKPAIGHYTQLVWGSTKKIGCGLIRYKTDWYWTYLVCNYGPSGNYIGQPVYQTV